MRTARMTCTTSTKRRAWRARLCYLRPPAGSSSPSSSSMTSISLPRPYKHTNAYPHEPHTLMPRHDVLYTCSTTCLGAHAYAHTESILNSPNNQGSLGSQSVWVRAVGFWVALARALIATRVGGVCGEGSGVVVWGASARLLSDTCAVPLQDTHRHTTHVHECSRAAHTATHTNILLSAVPLQTCVYACMSMCMHTYADVQASLSAVAGVGV